WVDAYAGFITADGTVFCITPTGLTAEFTPYVTDFLLDDGLDFGPAPLFEFLLNEHLPTGTYTFAATLTRAREAFRPIGGIAACQFTIVN
ncbi:MAG: hypothetical protein JW941_00505, partial [Candidatus Coatesbacteria bacterium]|nr:hypothetical protein [Candidatus Coatesbacteria bacterium]